MNLESGGALFPLSLNQRNIWDLEQITPETSINNISTTIRLQGRVDFPLLQKSILWAIRNNPSLRTRIVQQNSMPMQYYAANVQESFPFFDFTQTSRDGIENWETALTRERIPLLDAPLYRFYLFRTGERSGGFLIKIHHIISDGFSHLLLINRIGEAYLALMGGKEPEEHPWPGYGAYVESEQTYFKSTAFKRDRDFWQGMLRETGEPTRLKTAKSAAISPVGRRLRFSLSQAVSHGIDAFCAQNRISPFLVYYLAFAIYVNRIGGADRFTIGVPVLNRTEHIFQQTTGMFVSTLPLSCEVQGSWDLEQLLEHVKEQWYELLRHQRFPFAHMGQLRQEGQRERLFHIVLSYQNSQLLESENTSVLFEGRWHYSGYQAEQLCIHLSRVDPRAGYMVEYDYLTQVFSQSEMKTLHHCVIQLLSEALHMPKMPIYALSALAEEERERVLYSFNPGSRSLPGADLFGRFEQIAAQNGKKVAAIFGGKKITYGALYQKADALGGAIQSLGLGQEDLVAIALPRHAGLLEGMLGVWRAGCGFLLLSPSLPPRRRQALLEGSGAKLLVSTQGHLSALELDPGQIPVLDAGHVPEGPYAPRRQAASADLAYVVYTSGSTGTPKGVELLQGSFLNFSQAMAPVFGTGAVLSLCDMGFDAFMLESAVALLQGQTVVLPLDEELKSPKALAQLILGYGVDFLSLTPSRLLAYLKQPDFIKAAARLKHILCGGEAFPADLLQLLERCTDARIYNQYGPTEATVGVSLKVLNNAKAITIGTPLENCKFYVLDRWQNPLPVGVYGELYIGGLCVGRGYRGDPDLTAERFLDSPFVLGERMYRTGDLACWTEAGELALAGRLDRQVKLRGLRIEPQEVAACLGSHPQVSAAYARTMEVSGQATLLAYYTGDAPLSEGALYAHLADYLPQYMLPGAILFLDILPLTASGKVDEARLPGPEEGRTLGEDAVPETDLQRSLLEIFQTVLGRLDMTAQSDYFLWGGNSLNAMEALAEIEQQLQLHIGIGQLYAARSARRLSQMIEGEVAAPNRQRLMPAPELERYPLSPLQEGIYIQSQLDPSGFVYHMAGAFRLGEAPDCLRLEAAFRALIQGDPLFRTGFVHQTEGVFAKIFDMVPFQLEFLSDVSFDRACQSFLRPFDLSRPPLLRAALWRDETGSDVLFFDLHHIIGDGLSTPVMLRRLSDLYEGKETGIQTLTYLDYVYHMKENGLSRNPADLAYWKAALEGSDGPLELPIEQGRPAAFDYQGDALTFSLSRDVTQGVEALIRKQGISEFSFFLAAYGILLSKLSGAEDLLVGAPASGRLLPETQKMCGPFLNALPLRLRPQRDQTVETYLLAVQKTVLAFLDHQGTALEEILSALQVPRSAGQHPLYQVMFSQRPLDADDFFLAGGAMTYLPVPTGTVKMDLVLELYREGDVFAFQMEYATSLFSKEAAQFYARCYTALVSELAANGARPLQELTALSMEDRFHLIDKPNHTVTPYLNLPLHKQITYQMESMPEAIALKWRDEAITRREMERRACSIANRLAASGVRASDRVGLALERSPDLICGMLGILKAGAAYVPFLPSFPEQRICSMVETAGITHVLCDEGTLAKLPQGLPVQTVLAQGPGGDAFEDVPVGDGDLINVMFTSGSTGAPKGVMLSHRNACNMHLSIAQLLSRAQGPILCSTNLVFDSFIGETLCPLAIGKTIVLADEEEMMLPWRLGELIGTHGVSIIQFTPARIQMCLTNEVFREAVKGVKLVLFGGEVLTPALLKQMHQASDAVTVNMYGPTEATVYMTMVDVLPEEHISIGRPLENGRMYVLDEDRRPVLPTAYGELYLAGDCLAVGYSGRADLTEQAFLPDPFFPGERMYRTGDMGRLRLDGCYDFRGRRDTQVKLNGQRVELDEITGAMVETGFALQAAIVPMRREDGAMELVAFYVPNPKKEGTERELKEALGRQLPVYMIPSYLVPQSSLPYTPSSKIDLRALARLAQERREKNQLTAGPMEAAHTREDIRPSEPYGRQKTEQKSVAGQREDSAQPMEEAGLDFVSIMDKDPGHEGGAAMAEDGHPMPVSAQLLLDIWKEVLGREPLSQTTSFFDQGGTSLAALSVLSHYHNQGLTLSLAQFYQAPTAQEQAELFARQMQTGGKDLWANGQAPRKAAAQEKKPMQQAKEASEPEAPHVAAFAAGAGYGKDETKAAPSRYPRFVPSLPEKEPRPLGTVLLTGATGFLGAHLLRSLLDGGADRVICTVRGDGGRLLQMLTTYFGSAFVETVRRQVEVLQADISMPLLGLSKGVYQALTGRVDAIYHSAADVRHYAADQAQFLKTNVTGTEHIAVLARTSGADLHYISTGSVGGERLVDGRGARFTEEDFDMGQNWQENLYVKSKFLAEAAVLDAGGLGVDGRIYRIGRLVGRASDGVFQPNAEQNAFYLLLRAIHTLGAVPASMTGEPVEMTPVDVCADAIVALRSANQRVLHVQHPNPPTLLETVQAVSQDISVCPDEEFEVKLTAALGEKAGDTLAPLLDFWNRCKTAPPTVTVTNEKTMELLRDQGFSWPRAGTERLLRAFRFSAREKEHREQGVSYGL